MRRFVPFVRTVLSGLAIALVVPSQTLPRGPQRSMCELAETCRRELGGQAKADP